jgi:hypothetical protein
MASARKSTIPVYPIRVRPKKKKSAKKKSAKKSAKKAAKK